MRLESVSKMQCGLEARLTGAVEIQVFQMLLTLIDLSANLIFVLSRPSSLFLLQL